MLRLARELGYTKGRLIAEIDSRELAEWMAFFRIENEEREEKKKPNPKALSESIKTQLIGIKDSGS